MPPESKGRQSWEEWARLAQARIQRTPETAGRYCAADGCSVTKGITFNRPRALRRMIEEWQRPLRLVDLGA